MGNRRIGALLTVIKVKFFALLREKLGCDEQLVEFTAGMTLFELRKHLAAQLSSGNHLLDNKLLVAVNHELTHENLELKDNSEVAFFPPVTGG